MANKANRYAPEFRRQMVELVRAGRTPSELSREFGVTSWSIGKWVKQAARDSGSGDGGLTSAEREELTRLRRENRKLLHVGCKRVAQLMDRGLIQPASPPLISRPHLTHQLRKETSHRTSCLNEGTYPSTETGQVQAMARLLSCLVRSRSQIQPSAKPRRPIPTL